MAAAAVVLALVAVELCGDAALVDAAVDAVVAVLAPELLVVDVDAADVDALAVVGVLLLPPQAESNAPVTVAPTPIIERRANDRRLNRNDIPALNPLFTTVSSSGLLTFFITNSSPHVTATIERLRSESRFAGGFLGPAGWA